MKDSKELGRLAVNLQRHIHILIKSHDTCDQVCLVHHGVTASQGYALLALPKEGNLSMNELSEFLGIASSTLTRTIDPLVAKGLVSRTIDDTDRRIVRIELTAKGLETRKAIQDSLRDFFVMVLGEIPEENRSAVLSSMEELTAAFRKALNTCCPE